MKTVNTMLGVATLVALGLSGSATMAQTKDGADDTAEVEAMMATTMTLGEAITAAEASGGRAMSAEFDNGDDGEMSAYDVELVAADGTISRVVVDAADGSVKPYMDDGQDEGTAEGEDDDSGQTGEGMPEGEDDDNG